MTHCEQKTEATEKSGTSWLPSHTFPCGSPVSFLSHSDSSSTLLPRDPSRPQLQPCHHPVENALGAPSLLPGWNMASCVDCLLLAPGPRGPHQLCPAPLTSGLTSCGTLLPPESHLPHPENISDTPACQGAPHHPPSWHFSMKVSFRTLRGISVLVPGGKRGLSATGPADCFVSWWWPCPRWLGSISSSTFPGCWLSLGCSSSWTDGPGESTPAWVPPPRGSPPLPSLGSSRRCLTGPSVYGTVPRRLHLLPQIHHSAHGTDDSPPALLHLDMPAPKEWLSRPESGCLCPPPYPHHVWWWELLLSMPRLLPVPLLTAVTGSHAHCLLIHLNSGPLHGTPTAPDLYFSTSHTTLKLPISLSPPLASCGSFYKVTSAFLTLQFSTLWTP